jgi:hypothetical protein
MKKAVLFIDIADSSLMWAKNKENMRKSLALFNRLISRLIKKYKKSFIIKTIGDAYMISFENWKDAYYFSLEVQYELHNNSDKYSVVKGELFQVRIGIAYGELDIENVKIQGCNLIDYFGNTVNTASRMESKVSPIGGIGIVCLDDDPIFENFMMNEIKKNKFEYKILSFTDCTRLNKIRKRSARLLNDIHYICKDTNLLKGVKPVHICFKIIIN